MKIKLPRRRKKAYIKAHSRYDYIMLKLTNEVLYDDLKIKSRTKFPEFKKSTPYRRIEILFNW